MAVTRINLADSAAYPRYQYLCESTDEKPNDALENSTLIELDTGAEYYFANGAWNLIVEAVADGSIQLGSLNITANGRYDAQAGHAYRVVIVNVPTSGRADYIKMIERDASVSELPTEVTIVGDYAFSNYRALSLTELPDGITSIGAYSFRNCSSLALTALPNAVTVIDAQAFYGCPSLIITEIPKNVRTIGERAFYGCTGLTSITFLGTPTTINDNAFSNCTNITDIYVPWSQGAVLNAPWGAVNATIHYNWTGD